MPTFDPEAPPEPAALRRLRRLVSALLIVLIAGVVTVSATLVIRLKALGASGPVPPIAADAVTLPPGETVVALGRAGGEILVVTRGPDGAEMLRAFDAATGAVRSTTVIARE